MTDFDPATLRSQMGDLARGAIRLSAARDADAYANLVAAGESDRARYGMIRASGCGLVVRGLWRRLGFQDPRLEAPYETGSVMTTLEDMAKEAGAWHPAPEVNGGEYEPAEGDTIWIAGPDHVATFLAACEAPDPSPEASRPSSDTSLFWDSVDGGQRDTGGGECVLAKRRRVVATNKVMTLDGRLLVAVIDLVAMGGRFL